MRCSLAKPPCGHRTPGSRVIRTCDPRRRAFAPQSLRLHSNKGITRCLHLLRLSIRPLRGLAIAAAAAALVACGSDDDSGGSAARTTLSGIAAVGARSSAARVNVRCAGGSPLSTPTSNGGAWLVTISGQTLPCAVQVSGGTGRRVDQHAAAAFGGFRLRQRQRHAADRTGAGAHAWPAIRRPGSRHRPSPASLPRPCRTALSQVVAALGLSSALDGTNPLTARFQAVSGDADRRRARSAEQRPADAGHRLRGAAGGRRQRRLQRLCRHARRHHHRAECRRRWWWRWRRRKHQLQHGHRDDLRARPGRRTLHRRPEGLRGGQRHDAEDRRQDARATRRRTRWCRRPLLPTCSSTPA